jgi:predicted nucleotidyltransferase component of viral defense system
MTGATSHEVLKTLRRRSRDSGVDVQRLLVQYGIERFLARLAQSDQGKDFVLKGAQLLKLRIEEEFRPTRDVDLLGYGPSDPESIRQSMLDVLAIGLDDGLNFDSGDIRIDTIRNNAEYHGARVKLTAYLDSTRIHVQVDIGFGDATLPPPQPVTLPSLFFAQGPTLRGYRLETVIAEKLESMTRLGLVNGRLKDYYDLYRLAPLDSSITSSLVQAVVATFERRHTDVDINPTGLGEGFYGTREKQDQWHAFLRRNELVAPNLPEVCQSLQQVYGPILEAAAGSGTPGSATRSR